jgi:RNA polymerase sigma-54 factor
MTPQLQQAIKLLQLSSIELSAFVEDELLRNPMLEREENSAEGTGEGTGAESSADSSDGGVDDGFGDEAPSPDMVEFAATETMPSGGDNPLDIDHEAVGTEDGPTDSSSGNSDDRMDSPGYERMG